MSDEYNKPYMILTDGEAASLQLALRSMIALAEKHCPKKGGDRTKIALCKKALLIFEDPKFVAEVERER